MLSQIDDTQIHGFDVLGCRYQQILVFQPQSAWNIGRKKYEKCNSIYFCSVSAGNTLKTPKNNV